MARPVVHDSGEIPAQRTSPLYCRYHGFLIGQCLALAFVDGAAAAYATRRVALQACLRELDIDVAIPDPGGDSGRVPHAAVLAALLPRLAQHGRELADFAILGGLLVEYGVAMRTDADAAAILRIEIERLRGGYDLPPVEPLRHDAASHDGDPDRLLAPGLIHLGELVARLPAEADTALVLVPFAAPSADHYAGFHRPSLEHCGYRALRWWGDGGGEASAGLVLALIGKTGLVWADVSAIDHGTAVAIGATQALGKPAMIVAGTDRGGAVPAHVGRDAVIRYDPDGAGWPDASVPLMAACLAGLTLAAERGDRLRLSPGSIEAAFDEVSQGLGRILLPPDARAAQRRGRQAMDAGDLLLAEASFDEACRLGLRDDETRLWRGWARLGLGRFGEAAADLDAVVGASPRDQPAGEWRPIAAYLRAVLREAEGDLPGAIRDFELAVSLGLPDAGVRHKRDALAARVAP